MTIKPPTPPREPPLNADEISQVLRRFTDAGTQPIDAVYDLVRVRVGGAMTVVAVEILDASLDPTWKRRLETALVCAVNMALQQSALAAGQAVHDFTKQKKAGTPSE